MSNFPTARSRNPVGTGWRYLISIFAVMKKRMGSAIITVRPAHFVQDSRHNAAVYDVRITLMVRGNEDGL